MWRGSSANRQGSFMLKRTHFDGTDEYARRENWHEVEVQSKEIINLCDEAEANPENSASSATQIKSAATTIQGLADKIAQNETTKKRRKKPAHKPGNARQEAQVTNAPLPTVSPHKSATSPVSSSVNATPNPAPPLTATATPTHIHTNATSANYESHSTDTPHPPSSVNVKHHYKKSPIKKEPAEDKQQPANPNVCSTSPNSNPNNIQTNTNHPSEETSSTSTSSS